MKIKSATVVKCFNEQFFSLLLQRRKQTLETNYKTHAYVFVSLSRLSLRRC